MCPKATSKWLITVLALSFFGVAAVICMSCGNSTAFFLFTITSNFFKIQWRWIRWSRSMHGSMKPVEFSFGNSQNFSIRRVYRFIGFCIQCVYTLQINSNASKCFHSLHADHVRERAAVKNSQKYSISWIQHIQFHDESTHSSSSRTKHGHRDLADYISLNRKKMNKFQNP